MNKAFLFVVILVVGIAIFMAGIVTDKYYFSNVQTNSVVDNNQNATNQTVQQQKVPSKIEGVIAGIIGRELTIKSGEDTYKVTVTTDAEIYMENDTTGDFLTKGFIDLKVGQSIALSAKQVGQGIETSSVVITVK
jgi:hypothetical protein